MMEEWKDIEGYEGLYQISNMGRVKSLKRWHASSNDYIFREKIMRPTDNGNGYLMVGLKGNGKRKNHYVHRLVASAFLENEHNYKYVNHLDYNRENNAVDNLEWCTQATNIQHSADRMKKPKSVTHTNTGEKYISKRKNRYRVTIDHKEYGTCATLEEAVKKRDELMEEKYHESYL